MNWNTFVYENIISVPLAAFPLSASPWFPPCISHFVSISCQPAFARNNIAIMSRKIHRQERDDGPIVRRLSFFGVRHGPSQELNLRVEHPREL